MMKRVLCRDHAYLALNKKPISVVDDKTLCSKCRWEFRPWSLERIEEEFMSVVAELGNQRKYPEDDPFGYGLFSAFELASVRLLQKINRHYRKDLIESIIEKTKVLTEQSDKILNKELINMKIINKTKFEYSFIQDFIWSQIISLSSEPIESITISDNPKKGRFEFIIVQSNGVKTKRHSHQDHIVEGKIRWFDESSGTGTIRLKNNNSIHFYSCNVEGANQLYPELVSNIHFKGGDKVTATLSGDWLTLRDLGLIKIKKV